MDPIIIKAWVEIVTGILTIIAGLLTALWAYTKFVLERGLLPPAEFNIGCNISGKHQENIILEVLLCLKNIGSSTLIAKDIRVDIRCLDKDSTSSLFNDPNSDTFGKLRFPVSLRGTLVPNLETTDRGMLVIRYHTFIQAGVEQKYTFATAVPGTVAFVLIWASFKYELRPSLFQQGVLALSRRIGLLQYSLDHVNKPHTAERIFRVSE